MPKITLLLHNIRSAHNVGSIFRTAEGFGVKKIVCSGYTPYPKQEKDLRLPHVAQKLNTQIHKTALGAEAMVEFEYHEELNDWLAKNVLPILALEQAASSVSLRNYTPPNEFVLLLGEEVDGVSKDLLAHCQAIIEIPMHGQKESFNVSIATGVALYALTSS